MGEAVSVRTQSPRIPLITACLKQELLVVESWGQWRFKQSGVREI